MTTNRFISQSPSAKGQPTTVEAVLRLGLKNWRFAVAFAFACALITAIISLCVPNRYTAMATTLPASYDNTSSRLMAMADGIPGLDMMGLGAGSKSPAALYPEILRSRRLAGRVLEKQYRDAENGEPRSFDLYDYFDQDNPDLAYGQLQKITMVEYDKKTSVVKLSVTTTRPQLSADIANYFVQQLDEFSKNERKTRAGQTREFIEARMVEVRRDLAVAEENLKDFRDQNLNYYNSTSPDLLMEHARLIRDVEVKTQVYQTLAQERELAAINEKQETPAIQILDMANPPRIKSGPARAKITILGFLAGLFVALIFITLSDRYPQQMSQYEPGRIASRLYLVRRKPVKDAVEDVQHR